MSSEGRGYCYNEGNVKRGEEKSVETKVDFKKRDKELYMPKTEPVLVEVPPMLSSIMKSICQTRAKLRQRR